MKKTRVISIALLMGLVFFMSGLTSKNVTARPGNATSPGLGAAGSFSVLGETLVSNIPTSSIGGDVGLSPSTGAGIGLTDPEVGGTIYAVDGAGPAGSVNDPALLTNAINAMMGTFTALDQPCTTTYPGTQDLTIVSPLVEGVYCADAFLLTGNLTLNGTGVWIFKSSATLTTSAGSSVTGGHPCNVWWRLVSAADLGANSSMLGNILAGTSINMQNSASLNGRVLAQAAVTLSANTISSPVCVASPPASTTGTGDTTGASELPSTGGAPLWSQGILWAFVIIGGLSAAVYFLGSKKNRNAR